ncbi:prepilin peptidase [Brevibacterium marinum]|uniref:Prepilin type IV endopeptidase peptidase domain-containing protein n=1 Tax=Brevibacterium marinum TaxID=418643 RepID=A0A846S1K1_9MICO|nr:prepilin peptidase [Brevibacterium marinum]NJC57565.1 hypothetical protein [Brevibacterium marinum]
MVDAEVLHGMLIGLTTLISAATGLLLEKTRAWWLADDAHFGVVSRARSARGPVLVIAGILIAAGAVLLFPFSHVIPVDSGTGAFAPGSAGTVDPGTPNSADIILLGLILGIVAAATPFLITADTLVRRLPDRLVYPLIVVCLLTLVLGSLIGEPRIWFFGLIAGSGAAGVFAALHLVGKVLHVRTMGPGDVKLAFVVFSAAGLFDAWAPALVLIAMMLIAGIWALIAVAVQRRMRGITIAFGPAMLSGMWLGSVLAPILL